MSAAEKSAPSEPLILVIDDDPAIRIAIGVKLRGSGFRVAEAVDGLDGLEVFARERPQLVIVDVGMPRLDGYSFTERLQSTPEGRGVPVVILTAQDFALPEEVQGRIRVASFLMKPFSPRELVKSLRGLLAEAAS
ncbi:MAG: response regulator [Planctomycetes bacterium]|nr:response regulator [Planctomycetota bacterium]